MELFLGKALPTDAHDLSKLLSLLGSHTDFLMLEEHEVPTTEALAKRIANGREVYLLARSPTRTPLGYLLLATGGVSRNAGVGTLSLGVVSDYHKRGIGAALVAKAIQMSKEMSLYRLQLQVQTTNAPAFNLYRKFGFEVEGVLRKCSYIKGQYVDKYQMALLI